MALNFITSILGLALVIASGCVFNNYSDRHIDSIMSRTQNRALVNHLIKPTTALLYGSLLAVIGFGLLYRLDSLIAFWAALFGFIVYTTIYGYSKRHSPYGTLVGAFAGAVPPVVGYAAASGNLDINAIILFVILVFWQMPHFYAIAIKRLQEYQAAKIPVWPDRYGMMSTKKSMVAFGYSFIVSATLLTLLAEAGYVYLLVMLVAGTWWQVLILKGLKTKNNAKWAGQVFKRSLSILTIFSIMIALNNLLV